MRVCRWEGCRGGYAGRVCRGGYAGEGVQVRVAGEGVQVGGCRGG